MLIKSLSQISYSFLVPSHISELFACLFYFLKLFTILFVARYVPSAKECPLLLQLPNGEISKTNGFISPVSFQAFAIFLPFTTNYSVRCIILFLLMKPFRCGEVLLFGIPKAV